MIGCPLCIILCTMHSERNIQSYGCSAVSTAILRRSADVLSGLAADYIDCMATTRNRTYFVCMCMSIDLAVPFSMQLHGSVSDRITCTHTQTWITSYRHRRRCQHNRHRHCPLTFSVCFVSCVDHFFLNVCAQVSAVATAMDEDNDDNYIYRKYIVTCGGDTHNKADDA